ncbi:histidine synthase subunit 2 [Seminavis robusta]|uniref:Histidine synthase subunit 2 n=1 Tax=Seminavis robusta TaxID=568900 RepID=A0A9N8DCU3_9STRA|nr:histidine synthase subunit 2 [Seminavis robusta]|eukprot:Sro37_g023500.1 histidine synthase subunit 2 (618) ;mRNA; f:151278-153131
MTERAPQLLFDDGSRAIQQTSASDVETASPPESGRGSIPISKFYEIDRIAARIVEIVRQKKCTEQLDENSDHWFARVALQFPDALLCDSPEVCWEMEDALERLLKDEKDTKDQPLPSLVFCLGDTTFGPCCADEVAAHHLKADVLTHYGHACLSHPALSLPVIYGFGVTENWNTESAVEAILKQAKQEAARRILLLYQVRYQHAMEDLQTQLSERGDIFLVSGQVPQQPLYDGLDHATGPALEQSNECCQGTKKNCETKDVATEKAGAETTATDNAESDKAAGVNQQSSPLPTNTLLLGGLEVPKDLDFSSFTVVFVGDDAQGKAQEGQRQYMNTILWYLSSKSQPAGLWTYSPTKQTIQTDMPPGIQRQLNRRFYLIQKARDASIFGILIGTLSQRYFRSVVATLRKVIEVAGRSSYTFAMGKVNPAKVANFAEIECFVMVACAETSWLDEGEQREMHVPIITPLELHMALGEGGPETQWGECDYSLNYNDFLLKYPNYLNNSESSKNDNGLQDANDDDQLDQAESTEEDAPYFSLITGKYESNRKKTVADDVDLTALPGKGQLTTYKSEAAEFLKQREYRGLETQAGETEVRAAVPGQQGIASRYNNDLAESDNK